MHLTRWSSRLSRKERRTATARKDKRYQIKAYESNKLNSDPFSGIYRGMMLSPAWQDLTAQQKVLYVACKMEIRDPRKPTDDPAGFTMNRYKWSEVYGLYKANNGAGFTRDMSALINHGFVSCVKCGVNSRSSSIYRLSAMWWNYGTEAFIVSENEKTAAMRGICKRKKDNTLV